MHDRGSSGGKGGEGGTLSFGPFFLTPSQKLLCEGEVVVRLGSRALALLTALVERAGETVSNDELLAAVWPDTRVDEANLRVHVAAVRKALGDGRGGARYLTNVPSRGYCFVAKVVRIGAAPASRPAESVVRRARPAATAPVLIGRDDVVAALVERISSRRLVTIVGAAGIGKTAVARVVSERVAGVFADGARFVDLASVSDPRHVASALGGIEGVSLPDDAPASALVRELEGKRLLVVLDNCEHVVDAATELAEALVAGLPGTNVLATSRESLRARDESVFRLPALALPAPRSRPPTAHEALAAPAVELFVERAGATVDGFTLTDAEAGTVVEICQRLDGIPLAIELAAARVDAFGLRELGENLDGRFRLMMKGPRTALPRQQTLRGAMDWSYETLSEPERALLRLLSVFRGGFTLASAAALDATARGAEAADGTAEAPPELVELVAKSLVALEGGGHRARYRLLATTRAYAYEKLVEAGQGAVASRSHARVVRAAVERVAAAPAVGPILEALPVAVDDLRSALGWAYADGGDPEIGLALTLAAIPLAARLSLHEEWRGRAVRALRHLESAGVRDPHARLSLEVAIAGLGHHTHGPAEEGLVRAYRMAQTLDPRAADPSLAIEGMWALHIGRGDYLAALAVARELAAVAQLRDDPASTLNAHRVLGHSYHYVGEHRAAREHLERVVVDARAVASTSVVQIAYPTSARIMLARTLWIQGYADSARDTAADALAASAEVGHVISTCYALAFAAIPIAAWRGEHDEARRLLEQLLDESARARLAPWRRWGEALARAVDASSHAAPLVFTPPEDDTLPTLRAELVGERALSRAEGGLAGWCAPEILRAAGEQLLSDGGADRAKGEEKLSAAIALSAAEGAHGWQLRAAASLGRLRIGEGRASEAHDLLARALDPIVEGRGTADVERARALLEESAASSGASRDRRLLAPKRAR